MDEDNKSLANWLIVIFMFMFWLFRMVASYMYATNRSFIAEPLNFEIEIILLFVAGLMISLSINNIYKKVLNDKKYFIQGIIIGLSISLLALLI